MRFGDACQIDHHATRQPVCSGMHYYVQFRDPLPPPEHEPTLFEWVGGLPALTRMTRIFYEKYIPQEPPSPS